MFGLPSATTTTPGRTASTLQPIVSYSSASIGHPPDASRVEQLEQRHGRERLEHDREVVGDRRHDREQVQHVARTAIVREIAPFERRTLAREHVGELPMSLGVRPVAAAGGERVLVDPEEVAAVGARRAAQPSRRRDPRHLAGRSQPLCLALSLGLRHLQHDGARTL